MLMIYGVFLALVGTVRPPGEEVLQEVERCKAGGGIIGSMTPQICTKSVENVKLFEK